jgi:uncharacterized protein YbaR (Trm112 family)
MAIDAALLAILACPEDKGPLFYVQDESFLYNPRLRRKYAVTNDIAVMLVEESVQVDEAEHTRVTGLIGARGIKATFDA